MNYEIGGIITSKKVHPCGGNQWEVVRVGADVKLRCTTCKRVIFLSYDEVKKITKRYENNGEQNGR